jgi:hypothetical protein
MTHPTPKEVGFRHVGMWNGSHVLECIESGKLELWVANKGHASAGLRYKNTDLEFCATMTPAQRHLWRGYA